MKETVILADREYLLEEETYTVDLDCNIIARTTGEHETLQRLRQGLVRSSLAHEGALPVAAHASSPVSSAAGSRR